ncbi:MAG: DUF485 domain-containing protein [Proteobacteria bacterium]|nr:DUF485 domain-containing protein [Pseudomonadota bacterium]
MATPRYQDIEKNPKYQQLVHERLTFGWTLSIVMLVIYLGFILVIGYAPGLLGARMGDGVMTVGIPVGILVIVSAFVLVGIYVVRANATYDSLIRDIVRESR